MSTDRTKVDFNVKRRLCVETLFVKLRQLSKDNSQVLNRRLNFRFMFEKDFNVIQLQKSIYLEERVSHLHFTDNNTPPIAGKIEWQ